MTKGKSRPIASFPTFPFKNHRTMAEVMAKEEAQRTAWRERKRKAKVK